MDERGTLVNQLRNIRATLGQCLQASDHLAAKLIGPTPKDTAQEKNSGESVSSLVIDIYRQSEVLQKMLAQHHEFVGDVGANSPQRGIGAASGF